MYTLFLIYIFDYMFKFVCIETQIDIFNGDSTSDRNTTIDALALCDQVRYSRRKNTRTFKGSTGQLQVMLQIMSFLQTICEGLGRNMNLNISAFLLHHGFQFRICQISEKM